MAITVIPRSKSGGELFSEAFQPYLQYAMQMYLKQKMEAPAEERAARKEEREIQTALGKAEIGPEFVRPELMSKWLGQVPKVERQVSDKLPTTDPALYQPPRGVYQPPNMPDMMANMRRVAPGMPTSQMQSLVGANLPPMPQGMRQMQQPTPQEYATGLQEAQVAHAQATNPYKALMATKQGLWDKAINTPELLTKEERILLALQAKDDPSKTSFLTALLGSPAGGAEDTMIRVKIKSTGETGKVPANEFDPKIYEKI